jgi:predicted kinase
MIDNVVLPEQKKEKQFVEILVGLPASGKSTYALDKVKNSGGSIKRINKDNLRAMIDNSVFSKKNEKNIENCRDSLLHNLLFNGYSVIIDDTNLAPKHIVSIIDVVKEFNIDNSYGREAEVIINKEFLSVSLEECIQRDSQREGKAKVGKMVIFSMAKKFLPDIHKAYHENKNLNKLIEKEAKATGDILLEDIDSNKIEPLSFKSPAIICDLDGTLALLNGRNPYDASRCEEDILNESVAKVLRLFARNGTMIILLSGRENKYRTQTLNFLKKNDVPFDYLLMRTTKDFRKDNIIKLELYNKYIKDNFNVEFVLDDRNSVVDMWRKELNLPTFQVNYGDF